MKPSVAFGQTALCRRVLKVLRAAVPCVSGYFGNLATTVSLVCVIAARDRALSAATRGCNAGDGFDSARAGDEAANEGS